MLTGHDDNMAKEHTTAPLNAPSPTGRWVLWGYSVYLFLPMLLVLVGTFGENWSNSLLPSGFTFKWLRELWEDNSYRQALGVSVGTAVAAAAVNLVLGLPLALALRRPQGAWGIWGVATRWLLISPIAVPAVTLGFGYVVLFSSEGLPWLGSWWVLFAGHVVLTLPYMLNALLNGLRHQNVDLWMQAAQTLGATPSQALWQVAVPALRAPMASGAVLCCALSVGEFNLSNLVAGFENRTFPVLMLQAFYGATGFACAATLVLLLVALMAAGASARTSALGLPADPVSRKTT